MAALSLSAIEQALIAWLVPTFAPDRVILENQRGTQPALPYANIRVDGPRNASSPWPSMVQTFDGTQPAGQEIELRAVFEEELAVRVQVYSTDVRGDACAKALLGAARKRLGLPSVLAALRAAGLALLDVGDTQDVSALLETAFQGRAALDLRFLVADEVAERTGYVTSVGITGGVT